MKRKWSLLHLNCRILESTIMPLHLLGKGKMKFFEGHWLYPKRETQQSRSEAWCGQRSKPQRQRLVHPRAQDTGREPRAWHEKGPPSLLPGCVAWGESRSLSEPHCPDP